MNRLLPLPFLVMSMIGCASTQQAPVTHGGQTCNRVQMPSVVQQNGHPLVLNGMAVRDASIFHVDVYVGGLYLEQPTRDVSSVVESEQRKRLVLRFVHGVGRNDVVRAFRWGLDTNVTEPRRRFEGDIAALERLLVGVRNGDEVTFDYEPGRGITMRVNGRLHGRISNSAFAKPLLMVFVGPHGTNSELRAGLVGGVCND